MVKLDIIGQRFVRLLVVASADTAKGHSCWLCVCDCGNTVKTFGTNLKQGVTKSCGCLSIETHSKHGHCKKGAESRTYRSWAAMLTRCRNNNRACWANYGGRGIVVCDRWLNSFENFLEDMGERPKDTSIDRIDNDGNYEPGNCRWANRDEQRANQRHYDTVPF